MVFHWIFEHEENLWTQSKNEKYIGPDEAAEYLGISPVTLSGWIRNPGNEVSAHKIRGFWKLKCSEIGEWVNSGKRAIED